MILILMPMSFVACSDDDDNDDDDVDDSVSIADDGYEVSGTINGHYYVDLGLSVKWADRNIGALSSSAYGDNYAWGETETKDEYTESNSVTYGVEMDDIAGNAEYDAATANWGSKWRMPTRDEFEELLEKCSWVWMSRNGFNGYLVTGPNATPSSFPRRAIAPGRRSAMRVLTATIGVLRLMVAIPTTRTSCSSTAATTTCTNTTATTGPRCALSQIINSLIHRGIQDQIGLISNSNRDTIKSF